MNQNFFTSLPCFIIINIISRLPIRTIINCKIVCKLWLDLIESHEFAKFHLCKSIQGLAVYLSTRDTKLYSVFEFEDVFNLERHELHYNVVTKFHFPHNALIQGSANGLLFLRVLNQKLNSLYVCNPIIRDYIELHCPQDFDYTYPQVVTYGFGVSKMSSQYKVVRIFHDCIRDRKTHVLLRIPNSECHIYTLGTGSWRRVAPGAMLEYNCRTIGAFLNGNLHWLANDLKGSLLISCFDLETENFSTLSLPPLSDWGRALVGIFTLGDCLCLCDNTSEDEIVIWLMKEYRVERSWTKEFVISKIPDFAGETHEIICPIKFLKMVTS